MTLMPRAEVAALATGWAGLVEGHASAPLLTVSFTPAALLVMMDRCGMTEVEATLVTAIPVVDSRTVSGAALAGTSMCHSEAEDATPSDSGVVGAR